MAAKNVREPNKDVPGKERCLVKFKEECIFEKTP